MQSSEKNDVSYDRKMAIRTAKQLEYSKEIIDALRACETSRGLGRILHQGRKELGLREDEIMSEKASKSISSKKGAAPKKTAMPHAFKCPHCGEDCADDYYILNSVRVKEGIPYYAKFQTMMCSKCYNKLYEASKRV